MKTKKNIGIFTLNGYENYGNRLQNYALQETIKNLGFEVETILVHRKSGDNITNKIKKSLSSGEVFGKVIRRINRQFNKRYLKIRKEEFLAFTEKYIKEVDYSLSINNTPNDLNEKYDYFITGSDQVWNPNNLHGTSFFFLTFAQKEKRIAYAPSFGVSEIDDIFISDYKKWLSGMHKLSVREDDGAKIIRMLTGKDVPVHIDPTLLLNKEEWLEISKQAKNKPIRNYLVTYFLGGMPKEHKKNIYKIAKMKGLDIINLGVLDEKDTYVAGPSEFIDYI